jgi:hypothetical protein
MAGYFLKNKATDNEAASTLQPMGSQHLNQR